VVFSMTGSVPTESMGGAIGRHHNGEGTDGGYTLGSKAATVRRGRERGEGI
jgi:hypothetical protein